MRHLLDPSGGALARQVFDAIAVCNAGSSSIKFSLFAEASDELELVARGQVEGIPATSRSQSWVRQHGHIPTKQ